MSYSKRGHDYPDIMTVPQLAGFLNIGRNASYEQCHRPGFPALRIGKQLRIPRDALLRWLDAQTGVSGDATAHVPYTGD